MTTRRGIALFQIPVVIVALLFLFLGFPEIDWHEKETQAITYASEASTCDSAEHVKDSACNLTVSAPALADPPAVFATNTLAADDCDTATTVESGRCNARATPITLYLIAARCVGFGVIAGVFWILFWLWLIRR